MDSTVKTATVKLTSSAGANCQENATKRIIFSKTPCRRAVAFLKTNSSTVTFTISPI